MKCFEFPVDKSKLEYESEVCYILNSLEKRDIKVNINILTLEKLWYAFSETYDASFLIPNEELIDSFLEWARELDIEDARRMDYYGDKHDEPYEPWVERDYFDE